MSRGVRLPVAALLAVLLAAALAGCGRGSPRIRTILTLEQHDARGIVTGVARVNGELWVASWEGLTRIAGGKTTAFGAAAGLEKAFAQVRSVHAKGEILLLATAGGVVEFSTKTGKVVRAWTTKDGLGSESVRWVGEGRGAIWAGTIFGASRLAPGNKRWRNYRIAQGLVQDTSTLSPMTGRRSGRPASTAGSCGSILPAIVGRRCRRSMAWATSTSTPFLRPRPRSGSVRRAA
jgi:hypothetical protein